MSGTIPPKPPTGSQSSAPPSEGPDSEDKPRAIAPPPPSGPPAAFELTAPVPDIAIGESSSELARPSSSHRLSSSAELARRMSISPTPAAMHRAPTVPGFVLPHEEGSGGPAATLMAALYAAKRIEKGSVAREIYELGVRSLPFLCLVLAFVGSIVVYQAGIQTLRIVPDTTGIGALYIELLVRDLAASLTAMMLATRVGAGIAAEIGSMRVTDQLDALRLSKTDPVVFLVAPKLLACIFLTPLVTIIAGAVALGSGMVTGMLAFNISPATFLDGRFVNAGALLTGLAKSFAFGVAIPVVSAHAGLYTKRSSQGVGNATTRAVVGSSLAVIILGFLIGAVAQVLLGNA